MLLLCALISQRCVTVIANVKTKTTSICSFNIQQTVLDTPDHLKIKFMHATAPFISLVVTFYWITLIHDTHTITDRESVSMTTDVQRCLSGKVGEDSKICTPHFHQTERERGRERYRERPQPFTTMMTSVHFKWVFIDEKQWKSSDRKAIIDLSVQRLVLWKISTIVQFLHCLINSSALYTK